MLLLFAIFSYEEIITGPGEDQKHHGVGGCQRPHDVLLLTWRCYVFLLNFVRASLLHFGMCLIEVPVVVNHVGQWTDFIMSLLWRKLCRDH